VPRYESVIGPDHIGLQQAEIGHAASACELGLCLRLGLRLMHGVNSQCACHPDKSRTPCNGTLGWRGGPDDPGDEPHYPPPVSFPGGFACHQPTCEIYHRAAQARKNFHAVSEAASGKFTILCSPRSTIAHTWSAHSARALRTSRS